MEFKPDQFPQKQEHYSILDRMVLERAHMEQLPSVEKILSDMEQAVLNGKSEAAELIRELNLVGKIKEANSRVVLLDKSAVLGFFHSLQYGLNRDHPVYSDIEKMIKHFNDSLGDHNTATKRIRVIVDASDVTGRNAFARAQVLSTVSHEILHDIAKNFNLTWLNEGITERLTQGLLGDVIRNSKEWDEIFANLESGEDDELRFGSYEAERSQLTELTEKIRNNCSDYKNIPNGNYKELSAGESKVFKENFGRAYFSGDIAVLEKNLQELGYSSISELVDLDPSASE